MFSFFKQSACIARVSSTLQSCGMSKQEAHYLVDAYPSFFKAIIDMTKDVNSQQRNLIATISYLQFIKDGDPEFPSSLYNKNVYEALKYQLKTNENWKVIGRTLATVMHLMNDEKMMTDKEIEETFNPVNLELNNY